MTDERSVRRERERRPSLIAAAFKAVVQTLRQQSIRRLLRSVSAPRMREQPLRTSLTVLGVALGVAVWIAVSIVSDSVMHGVNVTIDRVAGKADLQLSTAASTLEDSLLERVRAVPGVHKAAPVVQQTATILRPDAHGDRVLVLGVDLLEADDRYFRDYEESTFSEIRKHELEFLNSTNNLLLSRQLAERFHLKLHDQLTLTTAHGAQAFDIWGFIEGDGIGQAFGGAVAVMYYPSMQMAFERGHQLDHVDVATAPGVAVDDVAKRLQAAMGEGFHLERPATRSERVSHMLAAVRTALTLACAVTVLAGAMLVFNTMAISLLQRRREIGTLRALGTTRSQLVTLFTIEGTWFGFMGSVIGVPLGVGLSHALLGVAGHALSKVYLQQAITDIHVRGETLWFGFASGVITATLAAAIPALKASRNRVAESLRLDPLAVVKRAPGLRGLDMVAAGSIVLAALALQIPPVQGQPVGAFIACFVLLVGGRALLPRVIQGVHVLCSFAARTLLGVQGQLANANLPRDPGRTAATATALMAGAALTIGFSVFGAGLIDSLTTWSAQSVPGDLYVTSGATLSGMSSRNMPMAPQLGEALTRLEGVEYAHYLRLAEYDYQGFPVRLFSYDTSKEHGKTIFLEGGEADLRELRRGKVTVSENFSHRFNVHKGDKLMLSGKTGAAPFEVVAVVVDYSSDIGTIELDRSTYLQHWGDDRVDTFELHLKRGANSERVRRSIQDLYGAKYDLFVLTNAEFRNEIVGAAYSVFTILRVVEFVLLMVASLGVINSLFASVLDRVREIGVLRALGMTRGHVGDMIMLEATLLGVVGLVGGALTGLALGYVIVTHITSVQTGWYIGFQVPWSRIAMVAAIKLPVAAASGWLPARHAARLVVRDALDYE
jgi:putative ABC transport system permease protein